MEKNLKQKSIIYARVSTREQEETGYSLDAQKGLLTKYANDNNLEIVKVFSMSESASGKKERVVFKEMLDYTTTNKITNIICEKTDRLTRNPKDAGIIDEWIRSDNKRRVHFVKESFIASTETKAHEGLVWNMKVSIAKFYTDNLSEEVKKGNAEKIKLGWIPSQAKFGYKTIGESGHKTHVPDEQVSPIIKKMFELYATGQYSIKELAKKVNELGLRSKNGKKLVKSNVARYLSDPFYYGSFMWNNELYNGKHEPLIDRETFDKVQQIKNKKTTPKYSKHNYLFKGKIYCKECGGVVTWEAKKGHTYGHCNAYRKCTKKTWYKEKGIDSKVTVLFNNLVLENKRFAEWLRKALKENNKSETEYREKLNSNNKEVINRIERKLNNLYEDRLDDRISVGLYDRKSQELESEKDSLVRQIQNNSNAGDKNREIGITIYELAQRGPELYQAGTLEQKRKILSLVFSNLSIENEIIEYKYTKPFEILAEAVAITNGSKMIKRIKSPIQIFEPQENGSVKSYLPSLEQLCPTVLGDRDSNPD